MYSASFSLIGETKHSFCLEKICMDTSTVCKSDVPSLLVTVHHLI